MKYRIVKRCDLDHIVEYLKVREIHDIGFYAKNYLFKRMNLKSYKSNFE